MRTSTPTLQLTGYLGHDAEIRFTTPRTVTRTVYDPILDDQVVTEFETPVREYARLSIAVHTGYGRNRRTTWYQLRGWDLDHHPDEARLRTARKGQRVEVEGYWKSHRYTDSRTGEEKVFTYLYVTTLRFRPGKLLQPRLARAA
jgi:hypothetical protein